MERTETVKDGAACMTRNGNPNIIIPVGLLHIIENLFDMNCLISVCAMLSY